MKTYDRLLRALPVVAVAALVLTGCGGAAVGDTSGGDAGASTASADPVEALGGQAAADQLAELYDAAKKAGESSVTIYGPSDQALADAGLYKRFTDRYPGISVNIVTTFGAEMDQKVTNEAASGNAVGDVVHTGTTVIKWAKAGLLQKFEPVGAKDLPAELASPDGYYFGNQFGAIGFMVNTSKISLDKAPSNWEDLADKKFSGTYAMTNPSGAGSLSDIFATLAFAGLMDESDFAAIKANDPLVVGSTDLAVQAVVTGERPVAIGIGMTAFLKAKEAGAPVDFVFPMKGKTPVVVTNVGVLTHAPNPNAAKLLAAWLFTPEAAAALPAGGLYGTRADSPAPEGFPKLVESDLVLPPPAEAISDNTKKTLAMLAKLFAE
ncbi:MAG: extracellular solute-binding protein [Actinobacteria bacterium]|nr:extracellular solute-binding protein [Actinomycetota bacterium]